MTAYLDSLLSLPGLYGGRVSPDGAWVAWSWARTAPTFEVYAAPTDGSQPPVRLTESDENTFLINWLPDSTGVLVMQDQGGNERFQVFRVALDVPLTMKPLTEANPDYFLRNPQMHSNGQWLVYGANYDFEVGEEIEQTYIYRHDLESGEKRLLAKPDKSGFVIPQLSPIGEHVLYTRKDLHPAGMQLWLAGIDGTGDREIVNAGNERKAWGRWFNDGRRVLVEAETDTHKKIGVWSLDTGNLRWLIDDPERNIDDAFVPLVDANANNPRIVLVEIQDARLRCTLIDPADGAETSLPDVPGNLLLVAPLNDTEWIARYYSSTQPADMVRIDLNDLDPAKFVSLTRVWERTNLTPDDLTPAEDFRWASVDDTPIQGWLYRAKGTPRGTIVYVHGGPTAHSEDHINNQIQYFANQGFNVLDPNYRGSTGFGLPFRESIKEDGWGGREQDDIRTGIEALIDAGIAERGKVGMTGTSYGGYSSWCGITRFPPDILAASAPICGMTDLVIDYHTTRPDLRPYSEEMLGGSPDEVPETYHARSPINFVDQIKGRLMIVQGMQDPNVTPENVNTVTRALQDAGIEYELLAFDDEGHGISKPANQKTLYESLVKFFDTANTVKD